MHGAKMQEQGRTAKLVAHPATQVRRYLRSVRLLLGETRDQVEATRTELSDRLTRLETLVASQSAALETLTGTDGPFARLSEMLRLIHDEAPSRRAALRELRRSGDYERAYIDPDPLVSVVIPTYDNYELLAERAIPSVLTQTYRNLEILVVGDAAPDRARAVVESFGDARIRFFNRPYRGPYPADPATRWLVAGVPPYNEAVRRAKGAWIAPLDDDDAFRPDHIERVLTHAREHRLELCYARFTQHVPGGEATKGQFPPELGAFALQAAVYHAALADMFELELADGAFGVPYDWALCRRMMEADVRIGMVEAATVDLYPSRYWTPRWQEDLRWPGVEAPEWEYVPEGFARARRDGDKAAIGWNAAEVAHAYREKWPQFLEALEGPEPLGINHEAPAGAPIGRDDTLAQNAILAYAFALARAADGSKRISVLDHGGALGHFYVLARRLFPEVELDYHCHELPEVCAEGRQVLPEVTFHSTAECFDRDYDLVLASSSLQYDEDWPALLRRLAGASKCWTLLTRLPITREHPSFVVLQRAQAYGYATEYLGWVFNRDELLRAARECGLELERELLLLPETAIDGAPGPFRHSGLLLRTRTKR